MNKVITKTIEVDVDVDLDDFEGLQGLLFESDFKDVVKRLRLVRDGDSPEYLNNSIEILEWVLEPVEGEVAYIEEGLAADKVFRAENEL